MQIRLKKNDNFTQFAPCLLKKKIQTYYSRLKTISHTKSYGVNFRQPFLFKHGNVLNVLEAVPKFGALFSFQFNPLFAGVALMQRSK